MKYISTFILIAMTTLAFAGDNSITVDQVGSYNTTVITQDGIDHTAAVTTGKTSDVDNTYIFISQQGVGAKIASVEVKGGTNNSISVYQDGAGAHLSSIQNLNGSSNAITINQNGSDPHTFNVLGQAGTINSGNTIDATQSGLGSKQFDLTLGGSSGANVTVQQTGNTANTGSMNVQCNPCGAYSYIRQ